MVTRQPSTAASYDIYASVQPLWWPKVVKCVALDEADGSSRLDDGLTALFFPLNLQRGAWTTADVVSINKDHEAEVANRDGSGAVSRQAPADFRSNKYKCEGDFPKRILCSGTRNLLGSVSDFGFHPQMTKGGPK